MLEVKHEVKLVTALLQVQKMRKERGLKTTTASRHLVFVGNPGTGKTTVARLLAQIYRTLGVVTKGHLVETDRSGLVAGYVGQTATKVQAVFEQADQGVLLIDEAYSLARGGERDFGQEAIDTRRQARRRPTRSAWSASWPATPTRWRSSSAPTPVWRHGFPRRSFSPTTPTDELVTIFQQAAARAGYTLAEDTASAVSLWLDALPRGKGFGNGREARNLFEAAIARHATQSSPSRRRRTTISPCCWRPMSPGSKRAPTGATIADRRGVDRRLARPSRRRSSGPRSRRHEAKSFGGNASPRPSR